MFAPSKTEEQLRELGRELLDMRTYDNLSPIEARLAGAVNELVDVLLQKEHESSKVQKQ